MCNKKKIAIKNIFVNVVYNVLVVLIEHKSDK